MTTAELTAKKIEYNKRTLELINNLSQINPKLLIEKDEDEENLLINGTNEDTSIAYQFKVPLENFDFEGDEVAFFDYSGFHEFYSVLDNPEITQDDEKFELKKGKSKITYFVSDSEIMDAEFEDVEFEDPDYTFDLKKDQLKNIQKMINLVDADKVTLSIDVDKVTLKLSKEEKDNFYEMEFDTSDVKADLDSFDLAIKKDLWDKAPDGDYQINVKEEGIVNFSLQNEKDVTLELYTGEIEED